MKVLVLNSGSSSIKFQLFRMPDQQVEASGLLERIGEAQSTLTCELSGKSKKVEQHVADHAEGLRLIMARLVDAADGGLQDIAEIGAVGHRVVHGGEAFSETVLIDDQVQAAIEEHIALAPLHNPPNLLGIKVARELLPNVPQVGVFDTAFHQSMPAHAYTYAVPHEWYTDLKVRRYGFHGTSHRYVAERAAELLGKPLDQVNLITAHLGNGASIAAIENGRSIDTSMGLTPLEGLVMGTRCGDLDPAIIPFLARARKLSVADIDKVLNKKSGLLGVSGVSNDMRSVEEAAAAGNDQAKLAVDLYCYRIKKYVGAYTAALRRVDAIVFTAGVGENSDTVREAVMGNMHNLGYRLDVAKNKGLRGKEADVATADSPSRILVIPTNEELMIAKDTYQVASKN